MGDLTPQAISDGLRTQFLGQQLVYYDVIDSTNTVAKALASEGAAEGTMVIADQQTMGRGRLGRQWLAPKGTSLLFSLIFRPNFAVARIQGLTMVCGLGVRQAIRELTGLPAQLKWPNDILLHGRKAGGILTEIGSSGQHLDYAVVGIGLNVNLDAGLLPAEFNATSISQELEQPVPRARLLQQILLRIEERYLALCAGAWPATEWASALETLGQWVELHTDQGKWRGIAEAVDDEGALLLRLKNGQIKRVLEGDISTLNKRE
ncbi:MAG: biotin--[acetyl-CoA-carboxylase] ligase [Anaerolineae bacterium]